jgi:hypothetical protein
MPTNTPNQGIPIQNPGDPANLPAAQTAEVGVEENRLAQRYTNLADRTARNAAPNENEISSLVAEDRVEVFDSANWVSLHDRSFWSYIRKPTDQIVTNSTVLVNDTAFVTAVPAAGVFAWEHFVFYDSSTTEDISIAYTWPAGVSGRWGGVMLDVAAGSSVGSVKLNTQNTSGVATSYGGAGVGTIILGRLFGDITMGGTAGNLQFQFAQASAAATNTTVRARSWWRVWRVS